MVAEIDTEGDNCVTAFISQTAAVHACGFKVRWTWTVTTTTDITNGNVRRYDTWPPRVSISQTVWPLARAARVAQST